MEIDLLEWDFKIAKMLKMRSTTPLVALWSWPHRQKNGVVDLIFASVLIGVKSPERFLVGVEGS